MLTLDVEFYEHAARSPYKQTRTLIVLWCVDQNQIYKLVLKSALRQLASYLFELFLKQ